MALMGRREVGHGRIGHYRGVDGPCAGVVGDARVVDVDGHALQRQRAAAGGQAQADHQRRPVFGQQRAQARQRGAELRGQLRRHHRVAGHAPPVQARAASQLGLIGSPPKGSKPVSNTGLHSAVFFGGVRDEDGATITPI
jgi:hypothetical protein